MASFQCLQVTSEERGFVGIVVRSICEPTMKVSGMYVRVVVVVEVNRGGVAKDLRQAPGRRRFPAPADGSDAHYPNVVHSSKQYT